MPDTARSRSTEQERTASESDANALPAWATPGRTLRVATLCGLALLVLYAFGGAVHNGWILLDDQEYVFENPFVCNGLTRAGLGHFLTSSQGGNWHPLTSITHMVDVSLFGLDPAGPHAVNVGLHLTGSLLAACVLFGYTRRWWPSLTVAALFALHPLRVESVAWISERKDVLSGVLFWITLDAYRRWTVHGGVGRYAWVALALALGLMAKPMLVTLPFVLVLLDAWPLGRLASRMELRARIQEKLPLFGLALASSVVTFFVQRAAGAIATTEAFPFWTRVANAPYSVVTYIAKSLWPHDLAVFYPAAHFDSLARPLLATVLLIALTLIGWRFARRHRATLLGWLWFVGMLVPVIGIVQVGGQSFADRYTYLPSIGLALALVFPLFDLVVVSRSRLLGALSGLGILSLVLAWGAQRQTALWKNSRTLFGYAREVTEDNVFAESVFGNALLMEGEMAGAIECLERVSRRYPGLDDVHNNLGIAYAAQQRYEEALAQYRLVRVPAKAVEYHYNVGVTLAGLERLDEARAEFGAALALDPRHYRSLLNLGIALHSQGKLDAATVVFARAIDVRPDDIVANGWLALVRMNSGAVEDAVRRYELVLRLHHEDLAALNNIAWIRATNHAAEHRDGALAVRYAERAMAASPKPEATIHSTLAAAYAEVGRFADAISAAEKAVELAQGAGDTPSAMRFREQMDLYRAGKQTRE